MDTLYYQNTNGERIYLNESPIHLQSENMFDYAWEYEGQSDGKRGGVVTSFFRDITEIDAELFIYAVTKEDFEITMNRFFRIIEVDVLKKQAGRIYTDNDQYLECFIISRGKSEWGKDIKTSIDEIKILATRPFWTHESTFDFTDITLAPTPEVTKYLDYPYDYPHDFAPANNVNKVATSEYAILDSDMQIIFEGVVSKPYLTLGNNHYEIDVDLEQNDNLILNTRDKSIIKYHANGQVENVFNKRVKQYDNFARLPAGGYTVLTNAKVQITIFEERSEPRWSF